jgi:hypothetical protein
MQVLNIIRDYALKGWGTGVKWWGTVSVEYYKGWGTVCKGWGTACKGPDHAFKWWGTVNVGNCKG